MSWYFDRKLLEGVADVWRRLAERFRFGSRVPRETIEGHWHELLACVRQWAVEKNQALSPFVELHAAMFGDEELRRDLNRFWRDRVSAFRKRRHEFEEVLVVALFILFWRAVRNANRYLASPAAPPRGWANPFWSVADDRLAHDLERASDAVFEENRMSDGSRQQVVSFSALQPAAGQGAAPDFAHDYQGRTPDTGSDRAADVEPFLARIREQLSATDCALFFDWWQNHESDNPAKIAERHGRSAQDLKELRRRAIALARTTPPAGGKQ